VTLVAFSFGLICSLAMLVMIAARILPPSRHLLVFFGSGLRAGAVGLRVGVVTVGLLAEVVTLDLGAGLRAGVRFFTGLDVVVAGVVLTLFCFLGAECVLTFSIWTPSPGLALCLCLTSVSVDCSDFWLLL